MAKYSPKYSPMIEQYLEIKKQNPGTVLFFRLGDFYEMFFEDAKKISKELDLTLTARDCGRGERAPMCGIPYHSCESYIQKLIKKGYKVAICEQEEVDPNSKNIVNRKVVRVITAGTIMESNLLDEGKNNYICSIFFSLSAAAMCFCDISTGSLNITMLTNDIEQSVINELNRFSPKEIIVNKGAIPYRDFIEFSNTKLDATVELLDEESTYVLDECKGIVSRHFNKSLKDLNIADKEEIIYALGGLLIYLSQTQMGDLSNINHFDMYENKQFMEIDFNTKRNLELTETILRLEKKGSLLWVLDKTKSVLGKRMLTSLLERPLIDIKKIQARQNAVSILKNDIILLDNLREQLNKISDIERLITKVSYGSCNARDVRSLADTLAVFPNIRSLLENLNSDTLKKIFNRLDNFDDIYELIDSSIMDAPPFTLREAGIIKSGFNEEVDQLRYLMENSTSLLAQMESKERERTGINKLKISYNRVFGYYIEVTNSYKDRVPENYIRKQTLANCERYITGELKSLENDILKAKDKLAALEYEIFNNIRKQLASELSKFQEAAKALALLDVLASFAYIAENSNYVCPEITINGKLEIKNGRHPVIEKISNKIPFVPNDILLDESDNRCMIITGPNMAGKSTYMRQIAIIVIMAQIGSFVPATSATIPIIDAVYTRVGASDDLSAGQSTFMVEMKEVAHILKKATKNSLIILDEIGRGTSTFDGMSIAKAVLEYCVNKKKLGAKTLFSTHYHELVSMESELDGIKNYNVSVKKRGDDISFLRRIVKGAADKSYGIEVAKLAGLPMDVISRSKEILQNLENNKVLINPDVEQSQINLFNWNKIKNIEQNEVSDKEKEVIKQISDLDMNTITPIEAMNKLFTLKNVLEGEE